MKLNLSRSRCAQFIAREWQHNSFADEVNEAYWYLSEDESELGFKLTLDVKGPRVPFNLEVLTDGFNQTFGTDISLDEVKTWLVFQ